MITLDREQWFPGQTLGNGCVLECTGVKAACMGECPCPGGPCQVPTKPFSVSSLSLQGLEEGAPCKPRCKGFMCSPKVTGFLVLVWDCFRSAFQMQVWTMLLPRRVDIHLNYYSLVSTVDISSINDLSFRNPPCWSQFGWKSKRVPMRRTVM